MEKVSILAITKDGVRTGLDMLDAFPGWELHAPGKFAGTYGSDARASWYTEQTSAVVSRLFAQSDGLVCLFSLGATVRLIAPHIKDKREDPAVIVIDEMRNFVISVLSGHVGGANRLARDIAGRLGARPVITTAADVKGTIPVDMIGRDHSWVIEDGSDVTTVSAHMVNEEKVGVYQDAGRTDWWRDNGGGLPANVTTYDTLDALLSSDARAHLIISDRTDIPGSSASRVVYRPPTLVVGVGVHRDTAPGTIVGGITEVLGAHGLSARCVARLASIRKPADVPGLAEAADMLQVPLDLYGRDDLAGVAVPNPSDTVRAYEGTPSVSEAACIRAGGGPGSCSLVVQKQKFPPDLTVAVARVSGA